MNFCQQKRQKKVRATYQRRQNQPYTGNNYIGCVLTDGGKYDIEIQRHIFGIETEVEKPAKCKGHI